MYNDFGNIKKRVYFEFIHKINNSIYYWELGTDAKMYYQSASTSW